MMSLAGGVLGAAASFYEAYQTKAATTKTRRMVRAMFGQQMAAYEESQRKIWGAYEAEKARTEAFAARQEELYKPYQETQLAAMKKYRAAAEAPETSMYAKLRMEESEKAINKELARRGILFSGAAAELRGKSRGTIMAEESERAKTMLQNLMTGVTPVGPAYLGGPSVPGAVGMPGIPGSLGGGGTPGGGVTQGVSALMAGLYGYQQAQGYKQQLADLQYSARQTGAPTGLYGGSMEQYAPGGW